MQHITVYYNSTALIIRITTIYDMFYVKNKLFNILSWTP